MFQQIRYKVKGSLICIALYYELPVRRSGTARVNEDRTVYLPPTDLSTNRQIEWAIKILTELWLVLVSRPAEGRRLSWPGWLGEILRWFARKKTVTENFTYLLTHSLTYLLTYTFQY